MEILHSPKRKNIQDEKSVVVRNLGDHHVSTSTCCRNPYSSDEEEEEDDEGNSSCPFQDMSSLLHQLPLKRGLSKHYSGKSQSFTSLTNVVSLKDLAKPENPYNKKLKTCGERLRRDDRHLFRPFKQGTELFFN